MEVKGKIVVSPPKIHSTDIDIRRIPLNELCKMRDSFPGHSDEDLARFLIAKDGNYSLAYDMYRKHLDWLENNPKVTKDMIINTLSRRWTYVHGYDLEGHPLLITKVSRHNKNNRDIEEVTREQLWWLDHLLAAMPPNKSKFTIVVDRSNASSINQDLDLMEHISEIFQANFPERLHRVILYPTGMMFYGMWNIVQYFLLPTTREKVCPQLSTEGCLQFVSAEYLPVSMGGNSTYEPDIENLDDPPSIIHSVLEKTKRYLEGPSYNEDNNHNNLNNSFPRTSTSKPHPTCPSSSSKHGDYRNISVSIDMYGDMEDMYSESEFDDEFSSMIPESSSNNPTGSNGQNLSSERTKKFTNFPFSSKLTDFSPAMMRGWGIKQGHIVKNWKKRYFVLTSDRQVTLLRYFKEEQEEYLCGELNLQYYHLISTQRMIRFQPNEEEKCCNCLELIGESSLDKDLLICIDDFSEYNRWIGAIEAHIDYRKEIEEIQQSPSVWRCVLL